MRLKLKDVNNLNPIYIFAILGYMTVEESTPIWYWNIPNV
jgi:hypothetical protein